MHRTAPTETLYHLVDSVRGHSATTAWSTASGPVSRTASDTPCCRHPTFCLSQSDSIGQGSPLTRNFQYLPRTVVSPVMFSNFELRIEARVLTSPSNTVTAGREQSAANVRYCRTKMSYHSGLEQIATDAQEVIQHCILRECRWFPLTLVHASDRRGRRRPHIRITHLVMLSPLVKIRAGHGIQRWLSGGALTQPPCSICVDLMSFWWLTILTGTPVSQKSKKNMN